MSGWFLFLWIGFVSPLPIFPTCVFALHSDSSELILLEDFVVTFSRECFPEQEEQQHPR
jgi:hypothetical protein